MLRRIASIAMMVVPTGIAVLLAIGIFGYWTIPTYPADGGTESIWAFDPAIGFVPRPHVKARLSVLGLDGHAVGEFDFYTDDRGARITSPVASTPDRAEVVTIGDSFTWGQGVDNEETFAARVGHLLGVSVVNLAIPAHGTTQSLQRLRANQDLSPKLVVYSFITDHLQRNILACARFFFPFCRDSSHVEWDESGNAFIAPPAGDGMARARLQVKAQREGLDPLTWVTHGIDIIRSRIAWYQSLRTVDDPVKQEQALRFLLGEMAQTVNAMHARLLIVFIPTHIGETAPPELTRTIDALHDKLLFLDLSAPFQRYSGASLYIPQDGHPSIAGHALIANEIAALVKENSLAVQNQ